MQPKETVNPLSVAEVIQSANQYLHDKQYATGRIYQPWHQKSKTSLGLPTGRSLKALILLGFLWWERQVSNL
jgi:hypothetical protein